MIVLRACIFAIVFALVGRLHADPLPLADTLPLPLRLAALWPQKSTPQTPHPAVVRVIATDRNSLSLGSGTLVDANEDYGLVITNWHVVRDAVGPIQVVFPDGFHSPAKVIRTDKEWDLASLLIWKPAVDPVAVTTVPPKPGEPLAIAGYGKGSYKMQSGACTQYLAPAPGRPLEIVEMSAAARQGDSGGPILNSRGELAGVLFGQGGGRTDGSYGGRVHQFLQLTARDLRRLPASGGTNKNFPAAEKNPGAIARSPAAQFAGGIASADDNERRWPEHDSRLDTPPDPRIASHDQPSNAVRALAIGAEHPKNETVGVSTASRARGFWPAWGGEIKSLLAIFGVAAIGLQFLRLFSGK
jgi:hypothetical protein